MPTRAQHRFLALGDSYTIGEGVTELDRWPVQLAAALRQQDIGIEVPEILACTGWTTDELAHAMRHHQFHPPYALITLLIGVNNQYRGRDLANYREEFGALLARAIDLASGRAQHVIVISIPDWGVTRFGHESGRDTLQIAREIDLYNAANAQIAASLHVRYVDVTALSRAGGDAADMLVDDGLHPSAAMYRRWTDAILAVTENALSSH
jgi:lysophospholipase L1-like esterase